MSSDFLMSLLRRRPFKPLRLTLSTNESFDVTHPDLAIVAADIVAVGKVRQDGAQFDVHATIWISLSHIVHVQPVTWESI